MIHIKIKRKPKRCVWKKCGHPWKFHQPGLFRSTNEPIKGYDAENFTIRLKKKVHKGPQGQGTKSV